MTEPRFKVRRTKVILYRGEVIARKDSNVKPREENYHFSKHVTR